MKNPKGKTLKLEKIKIAKLDNLSYIKGGYKHFKSRGKECTNNPESIVYISNACPTDTCPTDIQYG